MTHILAPLYGELIVSEESADYLRKFYGEGRLGEHRLHCTFCYSKKPLLWSHGTEEIDPYNQPSAKAIGYDIFTYDETDCLVLLLDCSAATMLHRSLVTFGASFDHPTYVPHITLEYGVRHQFDDYEGTSIALPSRPITFDKINYTAIKE